MTDEVNPETIPSHQAGVNALESVYSDSMKGDGESVLSSLYRRYFSKLVTDLRNAYGAGPPDPEEVAQRAFEKLHTHNNIGEVRNIEGFAWVCARNIILSEKRAEQVRLANQEEVERRFFGAPCDEIDPERVFIGREKLAIVMEALQAMPARRRRIFMLNRVHGLTPEQAGRQCGVSRSSAVRHIAVATAAIAEVLAAAEGVSSCKGKRS